MTLKSKIKHMFHPHGHNKTPSTSSNKSPTTSLPVEKPDPNKPPNARDPGFRKSFNLGEKEPTTEEVLEPRDTGSAQHSEVQNVPVSPNQNLHTLGEDYLAISPRTNATVPDCPTMNKGLSTISALDSIGDEGMVGLDASQESKPNDPISGAATKLDELSTSQQNPDYGRDKFARGERKDGGFVEPVPTRNSTAANNSPNALLPIQSQPIDEGASSIYSDTASGQPQIHQDSGGAEGGLNSPENPSKTTLQQQQYTSLLSDILADTGLQTSGFTKPPEYNNPKGGDFLAAVKSNFPDSSKAGEITPSLPAEGVIDVRSGLTSDGGDTTPPDERDKALADAGMSTTAVVADSNLSVQDGKLVLGGSMGESAPTSTGRQAEAFSGIIASQFESSKQDAFAKVRNVYDSIPDALPPGEKPITASTNAVPRTDSNPVEEVGQTTSTEEMEITAERPPIKPLDSVQEVTKSIPGAF